MDVSVENLKQIQFSELTLQEKLKIRTQGRPTPHLTISQVGISNNKKYKRAFNSEWYKTYKWLCGCETSNALFCFPLLLLGHDSMWTQNGFKNIRCIKEKCEKHETTQRHMNNVISLSILGSINIPQVSEGFQVSKCLHNEQVKRRREILSKIIDCLKISGNFEFIHHGDKESVESENPGMFKGLIDFMSKYDTNLRNHLETPVFNGVSKNIQFELMQCMLDVCRDHVMSEISESSYVAVMADDTTDISEQTHMVIVFRYELNSIIYERFWGYFMPENGTADAFFKCILNEINLALRNNYDKLIAQTYDGANFMKGEQHDIQRKIQKVHKNAHFIHSYAHHLSLIMKNVASSVRPVRIFFAHLSGLSAFFHKSALRLKIFNTYCRSNVLLPSTTQWNFYSRIIQTVYENKYQLVRCFQELQSMNTTDSTIQESTGFLQILNNEIFLFWLDFFHRIMPHVDVINNQMQARYLDAVKIYTLRRFNHAISEVRNYSYCDSVSKTSVIESKAVCDRICMEMEERCLFSSHMTAVKLFQKEYFDHFNELTPNREISETCRVYPMLVKRKLETELQVLYSRKEFHSFNGLLSLLKILHEDNLSSVFSETVKLLKILVTTPMITVEPECCFSTLKRIKIYLMNTTGQESLTALSMIELEREMINNIPDFNEKVIERFCNGRNQKKDFIFL